MADLPATVLGELQHQLRWQLLALIFREAMELGHGNHLQDFGLDQLADGEVDLAAVGFLHSGDATGPHPKLTRQTEKRATEPLA